MKTITQKVMKTMNMFGKGCASAVGLTAALAVFTIAPAQAAQMYFIHNDHLGTPQMVTDASQTVVWEGHRKPFGEVIETTNTIDQHAGFPGQFQDEETGRYYNYYRDYDPTIGRYIQSDPIGLNGGINTYAYVGGNPLRFSDPFGLEINLEAHEVAFWQNHTKLVIIPINQSRWSKDDRFHKTLPDGRHYATLGAGPEGLLGRDLVSNPNRSTDLDRSGNVYSKSIYGNSCPSSSSEDRLIEQLFEADSNFPDNLQYDLLPVSRAEGNNSNSYISGLLNSVGHPMPQPPNTPGFNKPVTLDYFFSRAQ